MLIVLPVCLQVPTNAQLTLTLLRVGEANKAPLPPPPIPGEAPPEESVKVSTEQLKENLGANEDEVQDAIAPGVAQEVDGKSNQDILIIAKPCAVGTFSESLSIFTLKYRRAQ